MKKINVFALIGNVATLLSFGASLVKGYTDAKEVESQISKEVAKEVAKQLKK